MSVTCHITFGQLSNFIGASLKVTWTIRNKKLHFTRGCFILLFKKKKRGPETRFLLFFFQWFWHLFFWYLNSNHNLPSYSLFLKCCWWFFYLGVYRGAGVFSCFFFFRTFPLARDSLSCSLRACLRLTEKRWKIAPVL